MSGSDFSSDQFFLRFESFSFPKSREKPGGEHVVFILGDGSFKRCDTIVIDFDEWKVWSSKESFDFPGSYQEIFVEEKLSTKEESGKEDLHARCFGGSLTAGGKTCSILLSNFATLCLKFKNMTIFSKAGTTSLKPYLNSRYYDGDEDNKHGIEYYKFFLKWML